jgi:phage-related tail fiber protein
MTDTTVCCRRRGATEQWRDDEVATNEDDREIPNDQLTWEDQALSAGRSRPETQSGSRAPLLSVFAAAGSA